MQAKACFEASVFFFFKSVAFRGFVLADLPRYNSTAYTTVATVRSCTGGRCDASFVSFLAPFLSAAEYMPRRYY